jgi:hypothetical protein
MRRSILVPVIGSLVLAISACQLYFDRHGTSHEPLGTPDAGWWDQDGGGYHGDALLPDGGWYVPDAVVYESDGGCYHPDGGGYQPDAGSYDGGGYVPDAFIVGPSSGP